ncbi:MAG: HDIG domain-containing metalloprotein [Prolixibacteraceae bacterium]
MNRKDAFQLLQKYVKKDNMLKHSLASEAVMRALALKLGEDVELWGLAGLLHDIDVEITNADAKTHGPAARPILEGLLDEAAIDAIAMHNEDATGMARTTLFQHALAAGETITGLITATAKVYPDQKLASVKTKSITKRMNQHAFAASVKRENILECELIGIPLNDFAQLALEAMQNISDDLGL